MKKTTPNNTDITRQEALKKMGKYAALTALGTFIVLNPANAHQLSFVAPESNPFENFD